MPTRNLRLRTTIVAGTCAILTVGLSVVAAEPASAATSNVLYAGQTLVANTSHDRLSSARGEFQLTVEPDLIEIDQEARLSGPKGPDTTGTGLWFRDDPTGRHHSNTDHSVLRLKKNGNLVLRTSHGHLLWRSHTKGSGSHNRLLMQANGNLAMYTAGGRKVWSSRTTGGELLPAGRALGSGQHMNVAWGDQQDGGRISELIMQRSGDLQYRCRSHVMWHSRTSVRGSSAMLRKDGDFVVYSPKKKILWSTHTAGRGSYTWLNASSMTLYNTNLRRLWEARTSDGC